ncbi:MAG: hypothetical protein ACU0B9_07210 [Limimaricola soesokkakensis]|uniref:hypothetical protein n=1 Tax=Limimaricola soesokkakensis TaxID=1343159 RepID=UPI004058705F
MTRIFVSAFALLGLMATPALAGHCPQDAAAIEHALDTMTISDEDRAEISALKEEGMALHEAGDHAGSEAMLADAMRRLLTYDAEA